MRPKRNAAEQEPGCAEGVQSHSREGEWGECLGRPEALPGVPLRHLRWASARPKRLEGEREVQNSQRPGWGQLSSDRNQLVLDGMTYADWC